MKHPFTDEDIKKASAYMGEVMGGYIVEGYLNGLVQALWDSAFDRGAVRNCYGYEYQTFKNTNNWVADTLITKENYEQDGDIDFPCAIIKLPEEKP